MTLDKILTNIKNHQFLNKYWIFISFTFTLLLIFFLLYHPIFSIRYTLMEDVMWIRQKERLIPHFITEGRILTGFYFSFFYQFINTIDQLSLLRRVEFFGWILMLPLGLYALKNIYQSLGFSEHDALKRSFILLFFFICSSSMAIYMGWSLLSKMFLAIPLSFGSGFLLFNSVKNEKNLKKNWLKIGLSIFLLILSGHFYQPTMSFFLLPFFIYFLHYKQIDFKILFAKTIFFIGVGIYFLTTKVILHVSALQIRPRGHVVTDYLGKLEWFYWNPLRTAFSLNDLSLSSQKLFVWFFPLLLLIYSVVHFKKNIKKIFIFISFLGIFLLLSHIAVLAVQENSGSYRAIATLAVFVFLLILELFYLHRSLMKGILFGLLCLLFTQGYNNFRYNHVFPLEQEYRTLQHLVRQEIIPKKPKNIYFIASSYGLFQEHYALFHQSPISDEFFVPSTTASWVPEPYIRQLLIEAGESKYAQELSFYLISEAEKERINFTSPDTVLIELKNYL